MSLRAKSLFITGITIAFLMGVLHLSVLAIPSIREIDLSLRVVATVIMSLSLAVIINAIFRNLERSQSELRDKESQLVLEDTIIRVAMSLMTEKSPDLRETLGALGRAFGADRAWLFLNSDNGSRLNLAYNWPERGTGSQPGPGPQEVDTQGTPWLWRALSDNQNVIISDSASLPPEAANERAILEAQGIRSAVIVPVSCIGETLGFMAFGDTMGARDWLEGDVRLLRAACQMIGGHTRRSRIEGALRESEERYRVLVENQDEGIATLDLAEEFTFANRAATEMFGLPPGGLIGRKLSEFTDSENFSIILRNTGMRQEGLKTTYEVEMSRPDGQKRTLLLTGSPRFDDQNRLAGTFGVFRDITEQKRAEAEIKYLSFHDNLTGLYNRAYFEEELRRVNGQRHLPISVIMGDVNGLKLINDAFGHHEGDRLLVEIAQVLKVCCRKEDVVARWGGDEFAIVLPRCPQKTAVDVCDRIRQSCQEYSRSPLRLSIALGAVTKEDHGEGISEILKEAEDRMYRNKLLESKSTRSSIFLSLRKTLRERSHETEEHAQRLQKVAVRIGRAIGLSDSKLDELSLLAALHDIGKIAIPDSILLKPSDLSQREWQTIKKHPEIGYRIAASSPEMAPIAEAILSHHERWDGTGYPQGLKGEQIPLISRIIAVADAYDAMTHRRRHKASIDERVAIEEIRRNAHTQFDPEIVRAFLQVVGEVDHPST